MDQYGSYPNYPVNYPYGNFQIPSPQPQMAQPTRPTYLPGRMVSSPDEIRPQEVLMDGNMSLFPLANGQKIYGKVWRNDGTIASLEYVLVQDNKEAPVASAFETEVTSRLDKIERMLSANSYYNRKNFKNNKTQNSNPKGGTE